MCQFSEVLGSHSGPYMYVHVCWTRIALVVLELAVDLASNSATNASVSALGLKRCHHHHPPCAVSPALVPVVYQGKQIYVSLIQQWCLILKNAFLKNVPF